MSNSPDLLEVKQMLSARLLRAGLRGDVLRRGPDLSVRGAVASAGQNVHAVGIGAKIVEGKITDEKSIRIYVVQKIAPSLLPPRDVIPETIDGIPTDIIESPPGFLSARGTKKARAPRVTAAATTSCTDKRRKRQRPLVAGISAAHFEVTAGTISYFCRSIMPGDDPAKVYVLSNNHVFANVNQASKGDDIHQPGPADGGTSSDHIAEFHRFVNIKLGGSQPNKVDAAIVELLPRVTFKLEICKIGKITGTDRAEQGTDVRKHGRTSGFTEGRVSDASYDALIGMDHSNPSIVALFQDQMRIERRPPHTAFGLGGDSGSLVVKKSSRQAVGLYFAGPPGGEYGVANHIADVLAEMQIELL
jgi:hypothetical protein